MLVYIGPGLGLGTIIIIIVVLLIVFLSIGVVMWSTIKRFWKRLMNKKNK